MANCPNCGAQLPADAPAGLCPTCLARAAQAAPREIDDRTVEDIRRAFAAHASDLELGELIGRGGMGFVFRGRQRRLSREVAVKVLDPELSRNPLFAERFGREAQMLARLAHPHIVSVHDYGRAGELFYLVLEYVDGVNLRQVLKARAMSPAQALAIVPQICEALEFAHGLNIVHRDIKPDNILLDRAGRVKIADFGLAKLCGVEVPLGSLTSTGQVLGTLRYMAPEQMERPLEVDHRADIYSLGVVFYEMLTGEIPMGRFAPPSQKVQVDVRLDEVVLHTLEREPERRYQHAVEVKTDVEAIGAGAALRSRRANPRGIPLLCWLAVASPAVAFGVPMLATAALTSILLERSHALGNEFYLLFAVFTFLARAVGCAIGWAALEKIQREWPRFYGVGAAMSGLWFPPLYALNVAAALGILFVTGSGPELGDSLEEPSPWIIAPLVIALLSLDVWWIANRRRRFIEKLEPAKSVG